MLRHARREENQASQAEACATYLDNRGTGFSLWSFDYSDRSAITGSMRVARQAGTKHAAKVIAMSRTTTPASTTGSLGLTSYKTDCNRRVPASPPATPSTIPAIAGFSPCHMT